MEKRPGTDRMTRREFFKYLFGDALIVSSVGMGLRSRKKYDEADYQIKQARDLTAGKTLPPQASLRISVYEKANAMLDEAENSINDADFWGKLALGTYWGTALVAGIGRLISNSEKETTTKR